MWLVAPALFSDITARTTRALVWTIHNLVAITIADTAPAAGPEPHTIGPRALCSVASAVRQNARSPTRISLNLHLARTRRNQHTRDLSLSGGRAAALRGPKQTAYRIATSRPNQLLPPTIQNQRHSSAASHSHSSCATRSARKAYIRRARPPDRTGARRALRARARAATRRPHTRHPPFLPTPISREAASCSIIGTRLYAGCRACSPHAPGQATQSTRDRAPGAPVARARGRRAPHHLGTIAIDAPVAVGERGWRPVRRRRAMRDAMDWSHEPGPAEEDVSYLL